MKLRWPLLLWLPLGLALAPARADTQPDAAALAGTWDVVRVSVDPADQPRWTWRPDDPRLLGRVLRVEGAVLAFDTDARCSVQRWTQRATTLGVLLRAAYPRPPAQGRAAAPSTAEMGLREGDGRAVTELRPSCRPEPDGRVAAPWDEAWLVRLDDDRLLLRHDQALLHLARRSAQALPRPSFDCTKAATPAERTICADVDLAAWDRSLALAWKTARQRRPDDATLGTAQSAWLQERGRCGTDRDCLRTRMQERVDELLPP